MPRRSILAALALASLTVGFALHAGCSKTEPEPPTKTSIPPAAKSPEPTEKNAPAPAGAPAAEKSTKHEKKPVDPRTAGTIRGVIRLDGDPPARKEMAIGTTAGCEKHPVPPLTEDVLVKDGKLANVFVYIKSGLEDVIVPPPDAAPVVLDQEGCMYRPRVLGMRVGQKLVIKNTDPATHNVHSHAERNEAFNQSQPAGGADVERAMEKPELMIPFTCDIHPWMKAFVSVRDHPFFAVTEEDGAFSLQGVPPGDYVIEALHEKYGKKHGNLTLSSAATAEITIVFTSR